MRLVTAGWLEGNLQPKLAEGYLVYLVLHWSGLPSAWMPGCTWPPTIIAGGWLVVGGWLPNLQLILRATRLHPSSQILRLKFKHKTKNCLNKIINKSGARGQSDLWRTKIDFSVLRAFDQYRIPVIFHTKH